MSDELYDEERARAAIQRWIAADPLWRRAVAALRASDTPVYLVGGSVRDALRSCPGEDMDVAVEGGAIALGWRLADHLGGAFYPMDREHDVARIVFASNNASHHIDLAGLRGRTIQQDLAMRDFTVNAMGVSLADPIGPVLDPTKGRVDLAAGVLRMAYPAAFLDDPLRMLRALRLSAALGLSMHPQTRAQIERQRAQLEDVSRERVRDEFLAMLALPTSAPIREAWDLALLPLIVPGLSGESALSGIAWLESLLRGPAEGDPLAHYWPQLERAWQEMLVEGRPRRAIVGLAALLTGLPAAALAGLGARLRLSRREWGHLRGILAALGAEIWAEREMQMTPLLAHRYYRQYGMAGVDGAVLAARHPSAAAGVAQRAAYLLWAWFDAHERVVAPPPLLPGQDLLREFGLQPGPQIGLLLGALAEAQAAGHVNDRAQARAWAEAWIGESLKGSSL